MPQTLDYFGTSGLNSLVSDLLQTSLRASTAVTPLSWRTSRAIGFNEELDGGIDGSRSDDWVASQDFFACEEAVSWVESAVRWGGPVACGAYIGSELQDRIEAQRDREHSAALERIRSETIEGMKRSWFQFWREREQREFSNAVRQGLAGMHRREQLIRKWYREDTSERLALQDRVARKLAKLRRAHEEVQRRGWRYVSGELVVPIEAVQGSCDGAHGSSAAGAQALASAQDLDDDTTGGVAQA